MPGEGDLVEIVHPGAAESAVGHLETGRLYNMCFDPQAGTKPENRSGILRNVGLEQGYAHALKMAILKRPPGEKVTVAE